MAATGAATLTVSIVFVHVMCLIIALHHYQHEYYKCWQAADVNVDVLCGSYCTSVHLRRGGEGSLICGAPSGFFFIQKGVFYLFFHVCTDSFTVDMSQSERFDHVLYIGCQRRYI